jgi:hypothetical protein
MATGSVRAALDLLRKPLFTPEDAQAVSRAIGERLFLGRPAPPPARGIPPAPDLATLPRITKGEHKGEWRMNKRQFAGWCTVCVATVSDWIHTGKVKPLKQGKARQSRVLIASGERERRLDRPVPSRRRLTTSNH